MALQLFFKTETLSTVKYGIYTMNDHYNCGEMATDDYTHRLRLGTPFIKHTESSVIRPCPGRLTVTKLTQLTVEIMVI